MGKRNAKTREENRYMDSGKYVNILIILNAMVQRFREALADIKRQQAELSAQAASLTELMNARE
jgi:hypothetical protein